MAQSSITVGDKWRVGPGLLEHAQQFSQANGVNVAGKRVNRVPASLTDDENLRSHEGNEFALNEWLGKIDLVRKVR